MYVNLCFLLDSHTNFLLKPSSEINYFQLIPKVCFRVGIAILNQYEIDLVKLAKLRLDDKMNLEDLAKRLNVSRSTIIVSLRKIRPRIQ